MSKGEFLTGQNGEYTYTHGGIIYGAIRWKFHKLGTSMILMFDYNTSNSVIPPCLISSSVNRLLQTIHTWCREEELEFDSYEFKLSYFTLKFIYGEYYTRTPLAHVIPLDQYNAACRPFSTNMWGETNRFDPLDDLLPNYSEDYGEKMRLQINNFKTIFEFICNTTGYSDVSYTALLIHQVLTRVKRYETIEPCFYITYRLVYPIVKTKVDVSKLGSIGRMNRMIDVLTGRYNEK